MLTLAPGETVMVLGLKEKPCAVTLIVTGGPARGGVVGVGLGGLAVGVAVAAAVPDSMSISTIDTTGGVSGLWLLLTSCPDNL